MEDKSVVAQRSIRYLDDKVSLINDKSIEHKILHNRLVLKVMSNMNRLVEVDEFTRKKVLDKYFAEEVTHMVGEQLR